MLLDRSLKIGRLQHLSSMELAHEVESGVWQINPQTETVLRAMGERGDIIRTMQRAFSKTHREFSIVDPATMKSPIVGRLTAKGLADELTDRMYAIVDGTDGRAHYIPLSKGSDLAAFPVGGILQIGARNNPRAADQTIARVADSGIYNSANHLRLAQAQAREGHNPEALVAAHVRRLEALRRAGIVERIGHGIWEIPADLPERGLAYDRQQLGDLDVKLITPLSIDKQVRTVGVTWLDQTLVHDTIPPEQGFGADARNALRQRLAFLVEEGLARRDGTQIKFSRNLLWTLQARELSATAKAIETETGLTYRPTSNGDHVSGIYRRSVALTSGRFAMLDDGVGFSLVPWRSVIEQHLGRDLRGIVSGQDVSWSFERSRGLSL